MNIVFDYLKFNNNGFNIPEFEFIYHLTYMELEHEHEYIDGKCECGEYEEGYIPNYNEKELSNLEAEITFWHAMGYNNSVAIDEIIRLFNEFYPNITVHQYSQGSYDNLRYSIISGIYTGTQPTIAQTYPHDVSNYLQANAIVSLDKYMNNPLYGITEKQLQDYIPTFLQECQSYDEKETLYSLPFNKSTEVLMFNASWFQKHGLLEKYNLGTIEEVNGEIVFVRNEGAMLTWEDIEEIGQYYINTPEYKSLPSAEKQFHYALAYDDDPNLFITLTQQFGGEFVRLNSDNKYEFAFNNKESKDAVEWFYNGFKSGYLTTSIALGSEYSSDHFISENVIMTIGSSAGVSYNDPGDRFVVGVLPYPQKKSACAGETQKYVIQQGTNVSLFKCDDFNEELAGWLFMKFLTTWHPELPYEKQPTVIFSQKTHYLPILTSIYNHEEYKSSYFNEYLYYNVNNVCLEQYDSYYVTPKFVGFQVGRDAVGNLIRAVLYGGYSIDEAFEDAIAKSKD